MNPRSARGHLALAALLASPDEGTPIDVSGAEEHLRSAHAINGEETGPIVRLGELLIVKGERGEAARLLEGAVRTNPKSVEARLLAGYLRYEAGDAAGAAALYRAAVAVAAPAKSSVVGEGDRKSSTPAPATPAPAPPLAATMGKTLFGDLAADVARRAEAGQAPLSDVHAVYAPLRARARALAARVTGPPQP
ncbi:MAG: tetratricopeptide repeat protein [Acidobacteriota bacterium]